MPLDFGKLSDTERDYLFCETQNYRGEKISQVPQRINMRAEIIHCLIQSNIPNIRVTALGHVEKAKHPLYRVIDSFFDDQGELQDQIIAPMRQAHNDGEETSGMDSATSEIDWEVKVANKTDALRTIQSCLLGTVNRNRIEGYFGCTEGIDEQKHGDEMEQIFAYLGEVFLPRGETTELRLEEQQSILEKLPSYAWESMTDWKYKAV